MWSCSVFLYKAFRTCFAPVVTDMKQAANALQWLVPRWTGATAKSCWGGGIYRVNTDRGGGKAGRKRLMDGTATSESGNPQPLEGDALLVWLIDEGGH